MDGDLRNVSTKSPSDGFIKPLLSCTHPEVTIADPDGDSFGFGLGGDDLTGVDACSAGNALLATVAYSSLSLDDGTVTTVLFDMDQVLAVYRLFLHVLYAGG